MPVNAFKHEAMATEFEIRLDHEDVTEARQFARVCFDEIDRLESLLSRFEESSDVSRINALSAGEAAILSEECYECLTIASAITQATAGVFDVLVGGVMDVLRDDQLDEAKKNVALIEAHQLRHQAAYELNEDRFEITCRKPGGYIDLGGIGKGYALDCLEDIFEEWGIENGLAIAGGSSLRAFGASEYKPEGWPVGIGEGKGRFELFLKADSVSASGTSVKGQHIIDPRQGRPKQCAIRSWCHCDRAAYSDALSTVAQLLPFEELRELKKGFSMFLKFYLMIDSERYELIEI